MHPSTYIRTLMHPTLVHVEYDCNMYGGINSMYSKHDYVPLVLSWLTVNLLNTAGTLSSLPAGSVTTDLPSEGVTTINTV